MEITGANAATTQDVGGNGFAQLDSAEFIRILTEELKNQDPLNPQDSSELMKQISSLRDIESESALQDSLKSLVKENQVAAASNLIGKHVEGLDIGNARTDGLVSSVRVTKDGVLLELDNGRTMPMDSVQGIFDPGGDVSA